MIKIIAYLRRNPALTRQEFRDYWQNVHAPLVRSKLPSLRHYVGSFPLDEADTLDGADAIVELGFDDLATMQREMNAAAFMTPERQASSQHLMDESMLRTLVVETVDVLT